MVQPIKSDVKTLPSPNGGLHLPPAAAKAQAVASETLKNSDQTLPTGNARHEQIEKEIEEAFQLIKSDILQARIVLNNLVQELCCNNPSPRDLINQALCFLGLAKTPQQFLAQQNMIGEACKKLDTVEGLIDQISDKKEQKLYYEKFIAAYERIASFAEEKNFPNAAQIREKVEGYRKSIQEASAPFESKISRFVGQEQEAFTEFGLLTVIQAQKLKQIASSLENFDRSFGQNICLLLSYLGIVQSRQEPQEHWNKMSAILTQVASASLAEASDYNKLISVYERIAAAQNQQNLTPQMNTNKKIQELEQERNKLPPSSFFPPTEEETAIQEALSKIDIAYKSYQVKHLRVAQSLKNLIAKLEQSSQKMEIALGHWGLLLIIKRRASMEAELPRLFQALENVELIQDKASFSPEVLHNYEKLIEIYESIAIAQKSFNIPDDKSVAKIKILKAKREAFNAPTNHTVANLHKQIQEIRAKIPQLTSNDLEFFQRSLSMIFEVANLWEYKGEEPAKAVFFGELGQAFRDLIQKVHTIKGSSDPDLQEKSERAQEKMKLFQPLLPPLPSKDLAIPFHWSKSATIALITLAGMAFVFLGISLYRRRFIHYQK